ncbi:hypothetical protein SVIOM342S_03489 [Streptomyces violaceorubidus]
MRGHHAERHDQHGGGHGGHRLRQPPGAQHREGQDAQQQDDARHGLGEDGGTQDFSSTPVSLVETRRLRRRTAASPGRASYRRDGVVAEATSRAGAGPCSRRVPRATVSTDPVFPQRRAVRTALAAHTISPPAIAATAQWLTRAYPASGGALADALCEAQARQAVTVVARLRYPTPMDVALLGVAGPGGSARADRVTGADGATSAYRTRTPGGPGWTRSSPAGRPVCWPTPALAWLAVAALAEGGPSAGTPAEFRRLLAPGDADRRAAALLRNPDLVAPVAALHHAGLMARLDPGRLSSPTGAVPAQDARADSVGLRQPSPGSPPGTPSAPSPGARAGGGRADRAGDDQSARDQRAAGPGQLHQEAQRGRPAQAPHRADAAPHPEHPAPQVCGRVGLEHRRTGGVGDGLHHGHRQHHHQQEGQRRRQPRHHLQQPALLAASAPTTRTEGRAQPGAEDGADDAADRQHRGDGAEGPRAARERTGDQHGQGQW